MADVIVMTVLVLLVIFFVLLASGGFRTGRVVSKKINRP